MNIWTLDYWLGKRYSLIFYLLLPWLAAYFLAHNVQYPLVKYSGFAGPMGFGMLLNTHLQYYRALEWASLVPNFKQRFIWQQLSSTVIYALLLLPAMLLWPSAELFNLLLLGAIGAWIAGFLPRIFTSFGSVFPVVFTVILALNCSEVIPLAWLLGVGLIALVLWSIALQGGWSEQATELLRHKEPKQALLLHNLLARNRWSRGILAPLQRWLHPVSYLFTDLLGWIGWLLLFPVVLTALVLLTDPQHNIQTAVYVAAFAGIFLCWLQAVVKNYREPLQQLWLLPCYQGMLQLRQAYVKAQWRLLGLLVAIMLLFGLGQAVITPTAAWAEQWLHITLMMLSGCIAAQLIGLRYNQDWRGLVGGALIIAYLFGADSVASLNLGAVTIILFDLIALLLILSCRHKVMQHFWRHGLPFE